MVKVVLNADAQPNGDRTAQVTINGETRTLRALCYDNGERYHIAGVAVRYRTGAKVWRGRLTFWTKSGNVQVSGGLDHRARRASVHLTGFYDADRPANSQHNGN